MGVEVRIGYLTKKRDACYGIRILVPSSKLNEMGHQCTDEVMEKQLFCQKCGVSGKYAGPYEVYLNQETAVVCPQCKTEILSLDEIKAWKNSVESVIENSDVVNFQRPTDLSQLQLMKRVKAMGKKITQVADDDYLNVETWNPGYRYYTARKEIIKETFRVCDAVDVTTPALKSLYSQFCKKVEILPNSIDLELLLATPPLGDAKVYMPDKKSKARDGTPNAISVPFPEFKERKKGNKLILWGGSPTHEKDLELCVAGIRRVARSRPDVLFAFVGYVHHAIIDAVPQNQLFLFSLVPNSIYFMLYKAIEADIGLAPVAKCAFNAGKSSNKIVECGALGIVPVASDFVTYQGCLPRVFYAGYSDYEWYRTLNEALECDPSDVITQNYEACKRDWDIAVNVKLWESYYKEVIG